MSTSTAEPVRIPAELHIVNIRYPNRDHRYQATLGRPTRWRSRSGLSVHSGIRENTMNAIGVLIGAALLIFLAWAIWCWCPGCDRLSPAKTYRLCDYSIAGCR